MRRATALAVGEGTDNAARRTEGELLKRLGSSGSSRRAEAPATSPRRPMRSRHHPPHATTRRPEPCWFRASCRSGRNARRWRTRSPTPSPISALGSGARSASLPTVVRASTATRRARGWRWSKETPFWPGSSSTTRARIFWGDTRSARLPFSCEQRRNPMSGPLERRPRRLPGSPSSGSSRTSMGSSSSRAFAPTTPGAPSTRSGASRPPPPSRSSIRRSTTPARRRWPSTRARCRRCRDSGARPAATCSASWWCGPGSNRRCRRRSPRGPPPAGAAIARASTRRRWRGQSPTVAPGCRWRRSPG